ncbi:MAG: hypothetical protein AB7P48_09945, partial [Methylocystis sp.]
VKHFSYIGGRPLEAMALLAIGYRSLTMAASAIGPVKSMILNLNLEEAQVYLASLLASDDGGASVREQLRDYAIARGVPL